MYLSLPSVLDWMRNYRGTLLKSRTLNLGGVEAKYRKSGKKFRTLTSKCGEKGIAHQPFLIHIPFKTLLLKV